MSVCIQRYLSYLFLFIIKSFNFSFYCYFKLLVVQSTIIVFILLLDPCCSLQIVFIQNMKWSEPLYSLNFYVFYSELLAQQLRRHSCLLKSRLLNFSPWSNSIFVFWQILYKDTSPHRSWNAPTPVHIHDSEDLLDISIRN